MTDVVSQSVEVAASPFLCFGIFIRGGGSVVVTSFERFTVGNIFLFTQLI